MSFIWLIALLSSIVTLLFSSPELSLTAMLSGANGAVQLSLQLAAMYGFWLGFFNILERIGIADIIAKILNPLIKFLFKGTDEKTRKFIAMNMSANLLGLGNAATPMGISAINSMFHGQKKATTNMIMLMVISSTSLQILPTTVIGMRASNGSVNPADFLVPCLIATVTSTIIGITLVKIISKFLPDEDEVFLRQKKKNSLKAKASLPLSLNTAHRISPKLTDK